VSGAREGDPAEVRGAIERVRYESEDGEFQVLVVRGHRGGDRTVVVRGHALRVGEQVVVHGAVRRHRSGELQVDAERVDRVLPKTVEGIESYLASSGVKGIGPKIARDIVATFGAKTLEVLDGAPARLREVPGIGAKRAASIKESWARATAIREVMIFLQSRGISPAYAVRIHKAYGPRAVRIVEADPYRLARDIRGIGFRIADGIARHSGFSETDPRRVRAGVEFALRTALDDGHTLLPEPLLVETCVGILSVPEEMIGDAIAALVAADRVARETLEDGSCGYMLTEVRDDEVELASRVARAASNESRIAAPSDADMAYVESRLGFALSRGQARALRDVVGCGVAVLTGGPGTGKTTIVKAALGLVKRQRRRVLLAAPTGRAAKRLSESTSEEARTIHRLLGFDPRLGTFTKCEDDPIDTDLLVVDEASMLDQSLALAVIRALPRGASLLLVGDVEQLPSVGAGNVLRDVIGSDVVTVARLDDIFRQAADSEIVSCAHAIRRGELATPSTSAKGEYFFIEASEPERAIEAVRRVVVERMPHAFGLSPIADIQCLTPMNTGALGTRALNAALQSALGIGGPALVRGERRLHAGDKVMQVRNNYDLDVFNGDIGVIRSIDTESLKAIVEFDGRAVEYGTDALDELTLAYAVTVHKSQGSEFRGVVLVLTTHHFKLLQRNLLYTAVTRARERLVIVGSKRALRMAIDSVAGVERFTLLRRRIADAVRRVHPG
jgi:exodeoxyribonuclease V alpha subunit